MTDIVAPHDMKFPSRMEIDYVKLHPLQCQAEARSTKADMLARLFSESESSHLITKETTNSRLSLRFALFEDHDSGSASVYSPVSDASSASSQSVSLAQLIDAPSLGQDGDDGVRALLTLLKHSDSVEESVVEPMVEVKPRKVSRRSSQSSARRRSLNSSPSSESALVIQSEPPAAEAVADTKAKKPRRGSKRSSVSGADSHDNKRARQSDQPARSTGDLVKPKASKSRVSPSNSSASDSGSVQIISPTAGDQLAEQISQLQQALNNQIHINTPQYEQLVNQQGSLQGLLVSHSSGSPQQQFMNQVNPLLMNQALKQVVNVNQQDQQQIIQGLALQQVLQQQPQQQFQLEQLLQRSQQNNLQQSIQQSIQQQQQQQQQQQMLAQHQLQHQLQQQLMLQQQRQALQNHSNNQNNGQLAGLQTLGAVNNLDQAALLALIQHNASQSLNQNLVHSGNPNVGQQPGMLMSMMSDGVQNGLQHHLSQLRAIGQAQQLQQSLSQQTVNLQRWMSH